MYLVETMDGRVATPAAGLEGRPSGGRRRGPLPGGIPPMPADARVRTTDRRPCRRPATLLAALVLSTLVPLASSRAAAMKTTPQTLSIPLTQTDWKPGTPGVP